ncbi:MAG: hypothetical protein L6R39_001012 [Caloplaca ligustica]|nr:MAG: hypothetical protein L6R39_001012 [Caloplaca ligustica]
MNFGRRPGFMEEGRDIRGIIQGNDNGFHVGALIGQVPWVNRFLLENKLLMKILAFTAGVVDPTADFVEQLMKETIADAEAKADKPPEPSGSVTTATSIGAVFYHIIKNPQVYKTLVAELREKETVSGVQNATSYKDSEHLPYL